MTDKQINNDFLLQLLDIKSKLNSNVSLNINITENTSITFYAEWGARGRKKYLQRIFSFHEIKRSIPPLIEIFIDHVNREMNDE